MFSPPGSSYDRRIVQADSSSIPRLVDACVARIHEREIEVRAWAHLDLEHVREQVRKLAGATPRSPLHGIPVGIKDIFDTADMPTEYGSPIYAGHQPGADAEAVATLRRAGAAVLGKTVTTEFATWPPSKTRNPHDPTRTPGGSSSGSAAAVAAGMVPLALGTQTVGSTIRPASFCGIVGFKPTHGRVSLTGAKRQGPTQETVGLLAGSVADVIAFASVLSIPTPDSGAASETGPSPRLAYVRTPWWDRMEPDGARAIEHAAQRAANAGADVEVLELPSEFEDVLEAQTVVTEYEIGHSLEMEFRTQRELISDSLGQVLERGLRMPKDKYDWAIAVGDACRAALGGIWDRCDAILTPAAPGEGPEGLDSTGDPTFARPWSLIGGPSISVPGMSGDADMPIGTQLVAGNGSDATLLRWASWLEPALRDASV